MRAPLVGSLALFGKVVERGLELRRRRLRHLLAPRAPLSPLLFLGIFPFAHEVGPRLALSIALLAHGRKPCSVKIIEEFRALMCKRDPTIVRFSDELDVIGRPIMVSTRRQRKRRPRRARAGSARRADDRARKALERRREANGLCLCKLWLSRRALEGIITALVLSGELTDVEACDHRKLENKLTSLLERHGESFAQAIRHM